MLLEAVDSPIRYRLTDGREVRLVPGQPIVLPEDRALKLLAKANGRVRMVEAPVLPLWLGCLIQWQAMDGKTYGPAVVEYVTVCDGRTWAFVRYDGIDRWVSEVIITAVEPGDVSDD